MVGKKLSEKSEKNVFYIHTNIVTKYGGKKTRETIFQKHKNNATKKCGEKKSEKVRKSVFYIRTNTVIKNGWKKKLAKQFFQKHKNSATRKCWQKNRQKSAKKRFLYSHEYRTKKMGEKTRETIFPETQ